jgi:alpha-tubulin suppressor-like RCC1 family protein
MIKINRPKAMALISFLVLIQGCSSRETPSTQNPGMLPPVSGGSNIGSVSLKARAIYAVTAQNSKTGTSLTFKRQALQTCQEGNCTDFTDINISNAANTEFALDLTNIPNNQYSANTNNQNLQNFLTLDIGTLFDNNLFSCANLKCDIAQIRLYTISTLGLYDAVSQQSVPLLVDSQYLTSATPVPLGSNQGLVIDQELIPLNQQVISLINGDFNDAHGTNGGYTLSANFTQAGAGTYTSQVVIEYDLASNQTTQSPLTIFPQSENLASNTVQYFSAFGGTGALTYSLTPNLLMSTPSSLVDDGLGDAVYTSGINSTSQPLSETIIVTDASGDVIQSVVSILPAFQAIPASQSVAFSSLTNIIAQGGVPPYSYALTQGTGTLSGNTYTAPAIPETDIVSISDSAGNTITQTITVISSSTSNNDSLISSYGQGGAYSETYSYNPGTLTNVIGTQQDPASGSIYLLGTGQNTNEYWYSDLFVQRLLPNGQSDQTFGTSGQLDIDLTSISQLNPTNDTQSSIQPAFSLISGNYIYILVLSNFWDINSYSNYFLVRTDLSGNIDQTYGNNTGAVALTLPAGQSYSNLSLNIATMLLGSQGFILATSNYPSPTLVEYDVNGNLVSGFGAGGMLSFTDPSCSGGLWYNTMKLANTSTSTVITYQCNGNINYQTFSKISLVDGSVVYGNPNLANSNLLDFGNLNPSEAFVLDSNDNVLTWSFIQEPDTTGTNYANGIGVQMLKIKSDLSAVDTSFGPNGDGSSAIALSPDDMNNALSDFVVINNNYYAVSQNCYWWTFPTSCFADTFSFTSSGFLNSQFENASAALSGYSYLNTLAASYVSSNNNLISTFSGGDLNYNQLFGIVEISTTLNPSLPIINNLQPTVVLGSTNQQIQPSGGSGSYTFSVIAGPGTIDSNGNFSSTTDGTSTILVVDSSGNATTEDITVIQFMLSQSFANIAPLQPVDLSQFIQGLPVGTFTYTIQGASPNGTMSGSIYTAGSVGNTNDTITISDQAQPPHTANFQISIGPNLTLGASEATAQSKDQIYLYPSGGGAGGYNFSITSSIGSTVSGSLSTGWSMTVGLNETGNNATDILNVSDYLGNQATLNITVLPTPPVIGTLSLSTTLAAPLNTFTSSASVTSPQPGTLIFITTSGGLDGSVYFFSNNSQIGSTLVSFAGPSNRAPIQTNQDSASISVDNPYLIAIQIGNNNTGAPYNEIVNIIDNKGIPGSVTITVPVAPLFVAPYVSEAIYSGEIINYNLMFGNSSNYSSALTSGTGTLTSLSLSSWNFTPSLPTVNDTIEELTSTDGTSTQNNYVINRGAVKKLISTDNLSPSLPSYCMIDQTSALYCWGQQTATQGMNYTSATPVLVSGLPNNVVDVAFINDYSLGENGMLAVLSDGSVWFQGYNVPVSGGSILGFPAIGTDEQYVSTMTQVPILSNVKSISIGENTSGYTCFVLNNGQVQCLDPIVFVRAWQNNGYDVPQADLWSNTSASSFNYSSVNYAPVTITDVNNNPITNVNKVSVSSTGYSCALKNDGTVWCWGLDTSSSSLGFGIFSLTVPDTRSETSSQYLGGEVTYYAATNLLALNGSPVLDLILSQQGGCFLIKASPNNQVWCDNWFNGHLDSQSLAQLTLPSGFNVLKLSASDEGSYCASGLDSNNATASYCWGYNLATFINGQLEYTTLGVSGTSTSTWGQLPPLATYMPYSQIAFGGAYTACGVNGSDIECWGYNIYGNLFGSADTSSLNTAKLCPYVNPNTCFTAAYTPSPIVIFNANDY